MGVHEFHHGQEDCALCHLPYKAYTPRLHPCGLSVGGIRGTPPWTPAPNGIAATAIPFRKKLVVKVALYGAYRVGAATTSQIS
jgi:hypothetical protein